MLAIAQHELDVLNLNIAEHIEGPQPQRRRPRRRRQGWTKSWILRRSEFGLYDQLMVELRQEDISKYLPCEHVPERLEQCPQVVHADLQFCGLGLEYPLPLRLVLVICLL